MSNKEWLAHLEPEFISEMENNFLDSYVVALEGWRRGLKLRWHIKDSEKFSRMKVWSVDDPGQLFSLSSENRTHYFYRTRGDKVKDEAVTKGMNKHLTKEKLEEANVPHPKGMRFSGKSKEDILSSVKHMSYPLVIKPTDGSFGRGVFTNLNTSMELSDAIDELYTHYNETDVLVEEHIEGIDLRIYVVDGVVCGAIKRVPPYVVGNGKDTIQTLIKQLNETKLSNPRLRTCLVALNPELEDYLKKQEKNLEMIPGNQERVQLSDKGNISLGGVPIDYLDQLSEKVKKVAASSLEAIEGLTHGAVDIILTPKGEPFVLELNPTAQLGGILFPERGKSRDIPKAIIDYYFPETKSVDTERHKLYFDYYDVLEPLHSRQGSVSTVTPAIVGRIFMKKYIVYGDVNQLGYHRGLRKQAFERGLHGHVMTKDMGTIEIVVAGSDEETVDDFKNGIYEDPDRSIVIDVEEENYSRPVKIGFDTKANIRTLEEEIEKIRNEIEETNLAIKEAETRRKKLKRSTSWRITFPLRLFGSIKKSIKK